MKHHTRGHIEVIIVLVAMVAFGAWVGHKFIKSEPCRDAYAAFRDGRAQVIEYTVPGSGKCRAVLIDGERKVEACE